MNLGLNLSFAVKRWLKPEFLASMCRNDFHVDNVQFTWDLIDPWWPKDKRKQMARRYQTAFRDVGISIDSAFGGVASYSYPQLLSPYPEQQEISIEFFKRAVDLTLELGAPIMGTPVGGMDYNDARNPQKRSELYSSMLKHIHTIAEYGKKSGLKEIHIEATPLITEFPHSPSTAVQMMKDLEGTAIPIKLLVDWGHALYKPLLKNEADINLWFKTCSSYIGSIHLQQTDGFLDRHWDFTKKGIVTPALIKQATASAKLDNIPQYLEVVTIFETPDEEVYQKMKATMDYLHKELDA